MNIILHHLDQGNQVSFARFNDGEIGALLGDLKKTSRGKQEVNIHLVNCLEKSLKYESENYYKGYPCSKCYPVYRNYFDSVVGNYPFQLPLSHFTNNTGKFVKKEILKVLQFKETCYIGSQDCNEAWLKRHFAEHSLYPSEDTAIYSNLIMEYVKASDKKIFIFAVGAISRYLAMETHKIGKSGLDLGSMFDPDTRNKYLKCHKWDTQYRNAQKYCTECNF